MTKESISPHCPYPGQFIDIAGDKLYYLDEGKGDPILFLHGIPTSSYIWRNIIPHVSKLGRCIALDLIGFGKSDQPDIAYHIDQHLHYLQAFIERLNLKNLTLVMHGFGSIVGLHYAQHHESNCKGLVLYESFLRSITPEILSLPLQEQINTLSDLSALPDVTNDGIAFIDKMIPQLVMRELTIQEMENYRMPFSGRNGYTQISSYLQLFNNDTAREQIDHIIKSYSSWLTQTTIPKLMLYSVPGFITTIATVMWAKEHLPALELIDIGEELHLGQESYPAMIGESIGVWLQAVEQSPLTSGGRDE